VTASGKAYPSDENFPTMDADKNAMLATIVALHLMTTIVRAPD